MRQIFPLGDYVRRTGDTMTGVLTIKRDASAWNDPHLKLQSVSAARIDLPIGFYDELGNLRAVVRGRRDGSLLIDVGAYRTIYAPWYSLGTPVFWRPYGFPDETEPRRVMMVESRLFGRR